MGVVTDFSPRRRARKTQSTIKKDRAGFLKSGAIFLGIFVTAATAGPRIAAATGP
jgi:hypothetical protein